MMAIQFYDGAILFNGTSIAMDAACCCEECDVCVEMPEGASVELKWVDGPAWDKWSECSRTFVQSIAGVYPLQNQTGCTIYSDQIPVYNSCSPAGWRDVVVSATFGTMTGGGTLSISLYVSGSPYGGYNPIDYTYIEKTGIDVDDRIDCEAFDGESQDGVRTDWQLVYERDYGHFEYTFSC